MCEVILCEDTPIFWTVVCDTIKKKRLEWIFLKKVSYAQKKSCL